jgi:hypothetical protein
VGALAVPAAAHRPTIEHAEIGGQQIACGATVLTFTDDAVLTERRHEHPLGGGRTRLVVIAKLTRGHLVDAAGNVYRASGGRTLNLVPEGARAGGHAHTHYVIRGNAFRGTVNLHVRLSATSEPVFRNNGSCAPA